jgi:hypothetical protein
MQNDRGFEERADKFYYRTRAHPGELTGELVELTEREYRVLQVLDDVVNKWFFINTRDLKKSLDALTAATVRRLYEDEQRIAVRR